MNIKDSNKNAGDYEFEVEDKEIGHLKNYIHSVFTKVLQPFS